MAVSDAKMSSRPVTGLAGNVGGLAGLIKEGV